MKHINAILVPLLITSLYDVASSARILGVFPMPAPSHYILGSSLMKALAAEGHDVTMISSFQEKNIPIGWKYRDVTLTGFAEEIEAHKKMMFKRVGGNPFIGTLFFHHKGIEWTEVTFNHTAVQKLLKSGEKFDVVIIEQFINEALKGLAPHFGASLIMFNTVSANSWINPLMGNPAPLSYIPDMTLGYPPEMNLWQRLVNTVFSVYVDLVKNLYYLPKQSAILKKYLPNSPDLDVLMHNISLALINSHVSTSQPIPHTPNMVEIGGYHVKPAEKLPEDLQKFLDDAKEGVVYFSMGSNLRSKDMPLEKREIFLKAFSKLKQKVLWKWEDDVLPGQPKNVELRKWFPQQSVLAHPNVKLFITHGGLLSTIETIYHGVPVLAIPIFGDQEANAGTAVNNGYGLKVSFNTLEEESFSAALNELLNNPKYRENAKMRSKLMHDRPINPMKEAIYWIEYVIRHKGATHFRSAALNLSWYQYLLLDVMAVIATVISVFSLLTYYLIKTVCSEKKKQVKEKKIKKK